LRCFMVVSHRVWSEGTGWKWQIVPLTCDAK
jgi:hypothetical protein